MVHTVKSKVLVFLLILAAGISVCGCGKKQGSEETGVPGHAYTLKDIYQVNGRQGICVEDDYFWVSGSTTLTKYDRDWNVVAENTAPFDSFDLEVNHSILWMEKGRTYRLLSMTGIRWSSRGYSPFGRTQVRVNAQGSLLILIPKLFICAHGSMMNPASIFTCII